MAVWPFLMGLSGVVLGMALFARNAPAVKIAGVIFAAYISGRIVKEFGGDYQVSAFAVIWLCAAIAAWLARPKHYGISTILLAVAMCYVWARVTAAPWVLGSVPFVVSDVLAVLAMLLTGWGLRRDVIGRISDMGRGGSGRGFVFVSSRAKMPSIIKGKKAG